MNALDRRIVENDTLLQVEGIKEMVTIHDISQERTRFKVTGYEGTWQAQHVIKFSNRD